jgi:hypothetical protein
MTKLRNRLASAACAGVLGVVLLAGNGNSWAADDPCAGFSWNVAHERSLFAGKARSAKAGTEVTNAPAISPDSLYELALAAQTQVHFRVPPGKGPKSDDAHAGLVHLRVPKAGLYRISVDQPFWIDVVLGEELVRSTDYQGAAGCNAPHKIVQFLLPAAQDLVLQVSGMPSSLARLTVTFAPSAQ